MTAVIPTSEAYVVTVKVASELTSGRIRHGAEISRSLKVFKASKKAGANVTLCGWGFRSKSVYGAERSLKLRMNLA
jgi:hypothetical protein